MQYVDLDVAATRKHSSNSRGSVGWCDLHAAHMQTSLVKLFYVGGAPIGTTRTYLVLVEQLVQGWSNLIRYQYLRLQ